MNRVLSFFLLIHCVALASFGQEVERISVAQVKDYGDVGSTRVLKGEFILHNVSDEAVPFRTVAPRCRCLTVTCGSEAVPAGGSSKIKFTYKVDVRGGYFDKAITVIPEGSRKPIILHIRGVSSSGR